MCPSAPEHTILKLNAAAAADASLSGHGLLTALSPLPDIDLQLWVMEGPPRLERGCSVEEDQQRQGKP